jgi:hypothetical protein
MAVIKIYGQKNNHKPDIEKRISSLRRNKTRQKICINDKIQDYSIKKGPVIRNRVN